MTAPAVPTGRNLLPSPNSAGSGWSGSGSAAAGGIAAAAFTPEVPITGMDRSIAGRLVQGGLTANGRIGVEQFVSPTDLDGLPFSLSVQIEADPTPQRCTNPVYAATSPAWAAGGGTGAAVTGLSGMAATTGYRVTKTSAAGSALAYSEAVACTAGELITGTLQVRPSAATTCTWYLAWYNSSGTQIATTTGVAPSISAGATAARAVAGTAPSGATTCRVVVGTGSIAVNATLIATGARIAPDTADPSPDSTGGGMLYGAAVSCALELAFLDVSGVRIGAVITGTTATIASGGAPVRAYVQGTAPTGCRRVAVTALYRSLAARQRVYATLARLDQVSDAALVGADGSTTGWGWDGVAERSSSGPVEDGENACSNPEARSGLGGGWSATLTNGATAAYVADVTGLTCSTALRCAQGTVAGNHWAYAPSFRPGRDMGGETWTVLLEGLESAAVSASVQLYPYDSAGANLGSTTGTAVAVAAGGVIRQAVVATLPAGTRSIRAAVISRSLPVGATVTVTAARYRRGSWPSLVFASGYSRAWGHDVREGGTSRRQLPAEWKAATDGTTASSVGTSIGYDTTQYQPGPPAGSTATQPIQTGGTPIPVEAAPFGRPGRATKNTIGENVQRWEHNPTHRSFDVGDDVFFSTAFALGADFPLDANDFQIIEQIHQAWGSWSPPVAFEVRQGGLYLTGGNGLPNGNSTGNPQEFAHFQRLADLQRERWYSLVYRIANFSEATGGSELWVWLDGVLLLDDWTIPCPTIVQGDASTRLSYRKQGFYHRPSLPGGTVWHAGAAMGNNYVAVDPYRTPLYATLQGAASAVSGTRAALAAPSAQTFGAAAAVSGSRAEAGPTVLADAGAATARSGTRALGDAPRTTFAAAPATSGTLATLAPSTPAAGQAVSGTRAEAAPTVTGAVAAQAVSGTLVPGPGVAVNPPLALAAVSGSRAALAATLDAAAAASAVSGTRALADGVRQLFARDGAAVALSGSRVEGGILGTLLAAAQAVSASRAEAGPFQTVAGSAVAVSGTRVGGVVLGTERAISGTVVAAGTRQTVVVAAVVLSGSRAELGAPLAETFGAAAARSGTVVALAGVVSGLAGPAAARSGSRAQAGADPTVKVAAALVVSGTIATADRPQLGQFGELAAVSGTIVIGTAAPPFRPAFVLPVGPSRPLVAAPQRRVYLVETMTGRVLWTMPHTSLSWSSPLNAIGDCSATLVVPDALDALASVDPVTGRRAQDPRATLRGFLLGPWRFSVVPCWGATPLMGGPLLPSDDVVGGKVAVKGVGMERMFEKRVVIQTGTGTYTDPSRDVSLPSTTPGRAVHQLISRAIVGAARGLPIVCTRPPAAAGAEDFTWPSYDLTKVWKAVTDLTARVDGPDVRLEPMPLRERDDGIYVSWNLEIGEPYLPASGNAGPAGPLPWTFSPPAANISRTIDPAGMATRYWATGDGQERAKVVVTADATYLTNVLGFPSLEEVDAATGGTDDNQRSGDLGGAQARANALRDAHQRPGDTWKVTLPMDGSPDLSLVRRGDLGRLEVRDKLYIDDGYYHRRITKIEGGDGPTATLSFDDDGADNLMTTGV